MAAIQKINSKLEIKNRKDILKIFFNADLFMSTFDQTKVENLWL